MDKLPVVIKSSACNPQTVIRPSWAYRSVLAFSDLNVKHPQWCLITPFAFQHFVNHQNTLTQLKALLNHTQSAAPEKIEHLLTTQPFPHALKHELSQAVRLCGGHLMRLTPATDVAPLPPFANYLIKGDAVLADLLRHWWAFQLTHTPSLATQIPSGWVAPMLLQAIPDPQFQGVLYTQNPHSLTKNESYGELSFAWYAAPLKTRPTILAFTKKHAGDLKFEPLPDHINALVRTRHGDYQFKSIAPPQLSKLETSIAPLFSAARQLQNHYYRPLMLRFTYAHHQLYLTHTQPLVESFAAPSPTIAKPQPTARLLAKGLPAGGGLVTAPALVIKDLSRLKKPPQPGSILITPHFPLSQTPLLRELKGLVTQTGGPLSHLAILSREYGLPSIMSLNKIPDTIVTGQIITINGSSGDIYLGSLPPQAPPKPPSSTRYPATKILFAANNLHRVSPSLTYRFDGIGLIRGETYVTTLGFHPLAMLKNNSLKDRFITSVQTSLIALAQAIHPLPMTYKLTDLSSHDRHELRSGSEFESVSVNEVLGDRGMAWLLAHPDFLDLELSILKSVSGAVPNLNLHILLPYLREPSEIAAFRRHFARYFGHSRKLGMYASIDTPASAFSIASFAATKVDGFVINFTHLSLLSLGLDPHTATSFSLLNAPGVLTLIKQAINQTLTFRLPVYLSAPQPDLDLMETAVRAGITGVIINPSNYAVVKDTLVNVETKIVS